MWPQAEEELREDREAAEAAPSEAAHAAHLKDIAALMQDIELMVVLAGIDSGPALARLLIAAFMRGDRPVVQVRRATLPPSRGLMNLSHHRREQMVYHVSACDRPHATCPIL